MALSVSASASASWRTCVWLVTSLSRNCFWTLLEVRFARSFSLVSDESRRSRSVPLATSASPRVPCRSCLSCVGEIDGNMRPPKLISSLALPRAPTEIGAACTVPKQVDRCLA